MFTLYTIVIVKFLENQAILYNCYQYLAKQLWSTYSHLMDNDGPKKLRITMKQTRQTLVTAYDGDNFISLLYFVKIIFSKN